MDLRIMMVGEDPCFVQPDIQLLRDKGFRVYTVFNQENIYDVYNEIAPQVVFFNATTPKISGILSTRLTNKILRRRSAIIYTISEDDTYMVVQFLYDMNRKHVTLADNLVGAVKTALMNISYTPKIALNNVPGAVHLHTVR